MRTRATINPIWVIGTLFFALRFEAQVCNSNGNLVIFTNYDGGHLTINVDQNIPNLRIGICSYECCNVQITGTFSANVVEVRYAGYNDPNNNSCTGGNIPTTTITGAGSASTSIIYAPSAPISNPNGYGSIICGYSCSNNTSQGGCNTVDQIEAYFLNYFSGSTLYFHKVQYGCWTGTQSLSSGGSCCPVPTLSAGVIAGSQTICAGQVPAPLSSSVAASGGQGTITYTWQSSTASPSSGFTNISGANTTTFAPSALPVNTWYRRAASTGTNSPAYSNVVAITVNPLPVLGIPSNYSLCPGKNMVLSAVGAVTFTWQGPANFLSNVQNPLPGGNGSYSVTATSVHGCSQTAVSNVAIYTAPNITATPGKADPVCEGDTLKVTGQGAATYTWAVGMSGQTQILTGNPLVLTPTVPVNFTVAATDQNGCLGSNTLQVAVIGWTDLTFSLADSIICAGEQTTMTVHGITDSLTWLPGQFTTTMVVVSPPVTTIYTVLSGEKYFCINDGTVALTVLAAPTVSLSAKRSVICAGESNTLTAMGAATYSWMPGNLSQSTVVISPTISTIYTVVATATNNCATEGTITAIVSECASIAENGTGENIRIFPNPTRGSVEISTVSPAFLSIYSLDGKYISTHDPSDEQHHKVTLHDLAAGVYILRFSFGNSTITRRLVVTD